METLAPQREIGKFLKKTSSSDLQSIVVYIYNLLIICFHKDYRNFPVISLGSGKVTWKLYILQKKYIAKLILQIILQNSTYYKIICMVDLSNISYHINRWKFQQRSI